MHHGGAKRKVLPDNNNNNNNNDKNDDIDMNINGPVVVAEAEGAVGEGLHAERLMASASRLAEAERKLSFPEAGFSGNRPEEASVQPPAAALVAAAAAAAAAAVEPDEAVLAAVAVHKHSTIFLPFFSVLSWCCLPPGPWTRFSRCVRLRGMHAAAPPFPLAPLSLTQR